MRAKQANVIVEVNLIPAMSENLSVPTPISVNSSVEQTEPLTVIISAAAGNRNTNHHHHHTVKKKNQRSTKNKETHLSPLDDLLRKYQSIRQKFDRLEQNITAQFKRAHNSNNGSNAADNYENQLFSSGLFSKKELDEYRQTNKIKLGEQLFSYRNDCIRLLIHSRKIWNERNAIMRNLYEHHYLHDDIVKNWDAAQRKYDAILQDGEKYFQSRFSSAWNDAVLSDTVC